MKNRRVPILIFFVFVMVLLAPHIPTAQASQVSSTLFSTPTQTDDPFGPHERIVVTAQYTDHAQVRAFAGVNEPWAVDLDAQTMTVDVNRDEYDLLLALRFRVTVDEKRTAERNRPTWRVSSDASTIPGYACYRTVEGTYNDAAAIATAYPTLAEWIDIGDSWQKTQGVGGYDLMVLRLTNEKITEKKPVLFAMTGLHAREYAPPELSLRFAESLINGYGTDPDITWILDHQEIHLLFHANPDGRKQAETGILWRKNTNQNYCGTTSTLRGADLNRNFSFSWNECGNENCSSGSQCSVLYRGPSAASEPETQAIEAYVRSIFPDQREDDASTAAPDTATGVFLDIHSYGEMILWPWGATYTVPPNHTALQTLGRKFAFFNNYEPQQAVYLYPTDGATDDFGYGELGIAAYTFEIGTSFFQNCGAFESAILPNNLNALMYAAKASRAPYQTPAGPDVRDITFSTNPITVGDPVTVTVTLDDTRFSANNGTEPRQNISAAKLYMTPPWEADTLTHALIPTDGSFDSTVETAQHRLETTNLPGGQHTLYLRGRDLAGNWGAVSAAHLYIVDPSNAPTLQGHVRDINGNALTTTVKITANNIFTASASPNGFYRMRTISDTFTLEASAEGYAPATVSGITASDGQTITQDFTLTPYCELFRDDVENGIGDWNADAPWALTTEKSHSENHAWTDSPGTSYANNKNISLTSPILDLSSVTEVTLDFWQICDTETDYDFCYVEAFDGTTWHTLSSDHGPHNTWEKVSLDASMLDGVEQAQIRFRLTSDETLVDDGWYIDDLVVRGAGVGCANSVPDNFQIFLPILIK
jgi:hypothetical protein